MAIVAGLLCISGGGYHGTIKNLIERRYIMSIAIIISIIGLCVSTISVVAAIYFSSKSSKKTDTREIEERVKENTRINMKLDNISNAIQEIKSDISSMRDEMKTHNDRIIKVEESAKQAHLRITALENRINIMDGGEQYVK